LKLNLNNLDSKVVRAVLKAKGEKLAHCEGPEIRTAKDDKDFDEAIRPNDSHRRGGAEAIALGPTDQDGNPPTRWATIGPPWGASNPHDSDAVVPEFEYYYGDGFRFAYSDGVWRSDGTRSKWRARYNLTKILPWNPTPKGWQLLRAHERAHCRGWDHYEGSPDPAAPNFNPCYYPKVRINAT
jgi:hypothetical protein